LSIEDNYIDLLAEVPQTIHHMCFCRLVALWEVRVQQANPDILASVTLGTGMIERLPNCCQTLLNVFM